MRNFILGCCVGVLMGVIGATYALSEAQSPSWYNDTIQGQNQRLMDIRELQFEQDLREQQDSYRDPWKKPC